MKQYNDQELDAKIETFLTKKLQKYPDLDTKRKTYYAVVAPEPSFSDRIRTSFTHFRPLAAS